jgi:hypothetical protein
LPGGTEEDLKQNSRSDWAHDEEDSKTLRFILEKLTVPKPANKWNFKVHHRVQNSPPLVPA